MTDWKQLRNSKYYHFINPVQVIVDRYTSNAVKVLIVNYTSGNTFFPDVGRLNVEVIHPLWVHRRMVPSINFFELSLEIQHDVTEFGTLFGLDVQLNIMNPTIQYPFIHSLLILTGEEL